MTLGVAETEQLPGDNATQPQYHTLTNQLPPTRMCPLATYYQIIHSKKVSGWGGGGGGVNWETGTDMYTLMYKIDN